MSGLTERDVFFLAHLQYDEHEKVAGKFDKALKHVGKFSKAGKKGRAKMLGTKDKGFFGNFFRSLGGAPSKAKKISSEAAYLRKRVKKEAKEGIQALRDRNASSGQIDQAKRTRKELLKKIDKAGARADKAIKNARMRTAMGYGAIGAGSLGVGAAGVGAYNLATND